MPLSVGQLAQLVEQRIENPRVRGSIPRLATKRIQTETPTHVVGVFAFCMAKSKQVSLTAWFILGLASV